MSVAKSVASSVARSVASSVAVSSAGGLFDPLALPSPAFIIPFTEGSGQIAHNAAGAYTSADPNIWYAPENMGKFGYGSGPTTATDRYADFASGDSAATRINIPTGQFWYCDRSMRL